MTQIIISGYTSQIWNAALAVLRKVATSVVPSNATASSALVRAASKSLKNGLNAINIAQFATGCQLNYNDLAPVLALPVVLDATSLSYITARINALQQAYIAANVIQVTPLNVAVLAQGNPSIPDPMFLEFLMAFSYEVVPSGLSTATFVSKAQAAATAWSALSTALQTQSVAYLGTTLNAVQRMVAASQVAATEASFITVSSAASLASAWNQIVALPAITKVGTAVTSDPSSLTAQETTVIRYNILLANQQLNRLLVTFKQSVPTQVRLATVKIGDTLMDIAARELGDFTQWTNIASLNGLVPPYVSNYTLPNVAVPGQQLFLPPGAANAGGIIPSYTVNYLGVDIYYGPLNSDMSMWTGDFNTISGYSNLSLSLGRRIQTTLGSLIYEPSFGSRIPPEVGAITSQQTIGHIQAYATSALLTDPRVSQVVDVSVSGGPNFSISVRATVFPNGQGQTTAQVNEVLQPIRVGS